MIPNSFEQSTNSGKALTIRLFDPEIFKTDFVLNNYCFKKYFNYLIGILSIQDNDAYHLVTNETIKKWKKSDDELFIIAQQNSVKVQILRDFKESVDLFMFYSSNDSAAYACNFEKNCVVQLASDENSSYGKYGSVLAIPNLGSVFVTPLNKGFVNLSIKQILEKTIQFYNQDPGEISYKLFWFFQNKWETFSFQKLHDSLQVCLPNELTHILQTNNDACETIYLKNLLPIIKNGFTTNKTIHKQFDSCLICNSKSIVKQDIFKQFYLVKCSDCNFVFTKQMPSTQEFERTYRKYGRNAYQSPITIKRFNELLDEFEKYRKTNKLLDVGCGEGDFLDVAKKRGWDVYGTEYGENAFNKCVDKGIKMYNGVLDPNKFEKESFDVVTSFEVLEHINNPKEEINNISKLIRKGGLFYCTTPNFNALGRLYLKNKYNIFIYPEHLCYYTPNTLTKLVTQFNFKKQRVFSSGFSISRLKISQEENSSVLQKNDSAIHKQDNTLHSKTSDDEKMRIATETKIHMKFAKFVIDFVLKLFGTGMAVKGYYIKSYKP